MLCQVRVKLKKAYHVQLMFCVKPICVMSLLHFLIFFVLWIFTQNETIIISTNKSVNHPRVGFGLNIQYFVHTPVIVQECVSYVVSLLLVISCWAVFILKDLMKKHIMAQILILPCSIFNFLKMNQNFSCSHSS